MIAESIISDIGKILVFLLAILSIYLVSAKNQRKLPNYLFAAFLILTAIDMTGFFLGPPHDYRIRSLKISSVLLQMPLFYLYVLAACYFNFKLKKLHLLHGVPFALVLGLFMTSKLSDQSYSLYDGLSTIQYYLYIAAVIYALTTFKRIYKANYSSNHDTTYKWLMRTTILFLIGSSFVTLRGFLSDGSAVLSYINIVISCFALFVICWFALSGLHHPHLFNGVDKNIVELKEEERSLEDQETLKKLTDYIESKKPYLNDKLTLQALALDSNIPEKILSGLINKHLGKHFFDLINSYRIRDAQQMLKKDPDLTVLEILYAVGFNSKSSFYTAFKKETGTTPTNFRKSIS